MGGARLFPASQNIPKRLLGGRLRLGPLRMDQEDFLAPPDLDLDYDILRILCFYNLIHNCEQTEKGRHRSYPELFSGKPTTGPTSRLIGQEISFITQRERSTRLKKGSLTLHPAAAVQENNF